MLKNTWEAKISQGFPSVGKPAMLLLASVSTGYLLSMHGASCEHQQGRAGEHNHSTGLQWLWESLLSTHWHRLALLLVTLQEYKSI